MKKSVLLFLLPVVLFAQNLQVHYDFGQDRDYVTSTLEMFKPDDAGAWFWFVDFDYNSEKNSMNLAYWEIARYFSLPVWQRKLSFKLEYNDGFFIGGSENSGYWGAPFYNAWLTGFGYNFDLASINFQTDLLYRYMPVSDAPDWQLTLVWTKVFAQGKLLVTGYFDLWTQDLAGQKEWIFQTEPQVWYMVTDKVGLGGEIEISRGLLFDLYQFDWKFMPTLGVRWNF